MRSGAESMGTVLGLYDDVADELDEAINLAHMLRAEYHLPSFDELEGYLVRMRDSLKKIVKSDYATALALFNIQAQKAADDLHQALVRRGADEAEKSSATADFQRIRTIVNRNHSEVNKTGRWFEALALIVIALAIFITAAFR